MTEYRRNYIDGGTYFFTVALAERKGSCLVDEIGLLRNSLRKVRSSHPFELVAMVVLPEHLHCIWTLPEDDSDYAIRWKKLKAHFSMGLPKTENQSQSRQAKGERRIWQRRYWEHTIRSDEDLRRHVDYIHFNPMKHGHVSRVVDWPHSTFHAYVERGIYAPDWAGEGYLNNTINEAEYD